MSKSKVVQKSYTTSRDTIPRGFVKFSLVQLGSNARVQANAWVETQMAFGQVRQEPMSGDPAFNDMMKFLMSIGGEPPAGSRFPGAFAGYQFRADQDGSNAKLTVLKVFKLAPADDAGMKVGDAIYSINGKRFKNEPAYGKIASKIGIGNSYQLGIIRDGQKMTLTLVARERPIIGTPEYDKFKAANEPVSTTSADASSVGDGVAKTAVATAQTSPQ